jgi:DNA processing protein
MLGIGPHGATGEARPVGGEASPVSGEARPAAGSIGRDPDERDAWVVLASVDGLGPVGFGSLLRRFGDGRSILEVARRPDGADRLVDPVDPRHFVDADVAARIVAAAADPEATLGRVRESGVTALTLDDEAFPRRLLAIELPPHLLFVRGDPGAMERAHAVAVVGTRRPTELGRRLAARIGAALADVGASVVSGLALGIDGAAHAACVAAGVPTVAVLGSGHARLFPRAHAGLAEGIVAGGGAVVSEFHPDLRATRGTFPRRNRLISGLADATVVVEAPLRSGALITAS